jgi:hypothetical protein
MRRYQILAFHCLIGLMAMALRPQAVWAQGFASSEILASDVPGVFSVATADFDGDGDMDVALAARSTASVAWMENRGEGVPMVSHMIWSGGASVREILAGDFTGDGRPDIILASYANFYGQFILARNTGQGPDYFHLEVICDAANGAYAVASGDIDGDDDLDLVTAEYRGNVIRVFRNDPDSLRQSAALSVASPIHVQFVDMDGDGDMDVIGSAEIHNLFWVEHQGTAWTLRTLDFGYNCQAVAAQDLDGDGDIDIVAGSYNGSTVDWWEHTQTGYLQHALAGSLPQMYDVKITDLDMDGDPDIVAAGQTGIICWWKNDGNHVFTRQNIPTATYAAYCKLTIEDFDRDGDPDLIVADASTEISAIRLFRNTIGIPAYIWGTVVSAEDQTPVRDAIVRIQEMGSASRTDSLGRYRLPCAPGDYTVRVSRVCWNPAQFEGIHTTEGETTLLNVSLQHPAYELNATSLNLMVQNHESQVIPIQIRNSGDGLLSLTAQAGGNPVPETWLSVTPLTVELVPGDSVTLWVTVAPDTVDTNNWDYYGWVRLTSNACPDTVQNIFVMAYVLDTPNRIPSLPGRTALIGAYPNPFNGSTTIEFELAAPAAVELNLFDVLGREVRHQQMQQNAGIQRMALDADALPSGVYVLGVKLGSQFFSRKLLLIR